MENDLLTQIIDGLGIDRKDVNAIPALTLAYLGDCIYELVIRTMLVERGITHVSDLNKAAVGFVKAATQKDMFFSIEDILTEEEMSVFRRGRNVKSSSCPKNASVTDYHTATGFEALMGYLYLKERTERLIELIRIGMDKREG